MFDRFFKKEGVTLPEGRDAPDAKPITHTLHRSEGFLQGQLLVATPQIVGSCFEKSVIYLFAHNQEGAMGLIINQPIEQVHHSALLDEEDIETLPRIILDEIDVCYGGPVEPSRGFVLHSGEYNEEHTLLCHNGIALSASTRILKDMITGKGPKTSQLMVGYAGWSPGQLEKEIEENSWITVPASRKLIFDTDHDLQWTMASQSLGVDMAFFSPHVGHA